MNIDIPVPPNAHNVRSASERWRDHLMGSDLLSGCPICHIGETEFEEDILCDIGRKLRDDSLNDAYVEPPEAILKEARKALWEAQVALNHAVTYHFSGAYLQAQRRIDEARTWMRFCDGRIGAATAEISGGES